MSWIIFDLDGTLANIEARRLKATKDNGKINWGEFFNPENIPLDEPIHPAIELFKALKHTHQIAIMSGRGEECRLATEVWMAQWGIDPDLLIMRPVENYTPDDQLKEGWLRERFPDLKQVVAVFDDRDKVVQMWRRNGLLCCQVAPGDF